MRSALKTLIPGPVRAAVSDWRLNRLAQAPRYAQFGQEMLELLIEQGHITPSSHLLEMGCGPGRLASALVKYLDAEGSYDGVDILKGEIDWCRKTYTVKRPNLRFQHANLFNKYYNASGTSSATDYAFPFPDASFDCIYMQSVFTHMLWPEIRQYVKETARVLKPGARCVITYYLTHTPADPYDNPYFPHALDGCQVHDLTFPEWAVAFREEDIRRLYAQNGLKMVEPLRYGHEHDKPSPSHAQDIVTAEKL